jgi:hypothetical protein
LLPLECQRTKHSEQQHRSPFSQRRLGSSTVIVIRIRKLFVRRTAGQAVLPLRSKAVLIQRWDRTGDAGEIDVGSLLVDEAFSLLPVESRCLMVNRDASHYVRELSRLEEEGLFRSELRGNQIIASRTERSDATKTFMTSKTITVA